MDHGLMVVAGPASTRLGGDVCEALAAQPATYECRRFPDGEIQINMLESVRGRDVFIVQSTSPPPDVHLMELLLLADACRRGGAARMTAVIPYFGYARQDRRAARTSLGARVAANAIAGADFDRLMLIDAHTPAIEGFFDVPLDHLTAIPLLARAAAPSVGDNAVVVAPDFGAVKRAREYARLFRTPMAFVHKTRLSGEVVEAQGVIGDVRGKRPIVVDDMLSTGGTIEAALNALGQAGAAMPALVIVTHALLAGRARDILRPLPIARLIAGDTVALDQPAEPHLELTGIAPLIATAIRRTHRDESLADLRAPV